MKNFFSIILLKKQFFSYHLKPLLFYKQPLQHSIQKRKSYPNIFNPIQIQSYRVIETSYPFLLKHKVNPYFHPQKSKAVETGRHAMTVEFLFIEWTTLVQQCSKAICFNTIKASAIGWIYRYCAGLLFYRFGTERDGKSGGNNHGSR